MFNRKFNFTFNKLISLDKKKKEKEIRKKLTYICSNEI